MSFVLGIDLSSHAIDLVSLDETSSCAEWRRCPLHGATAFERCRAVRAAMPPPAWFDGCYLAAIERPKTHSFISAAAQFPVFGAALACMPAALEVWDVSPADWRIGLGLKGNAPKAEIREAVWRLPGGERFTGLTDLDGPPQDALDAWACAFYARELNARGLALEEARERQLVLV